MTQAAAMASSGAWSPWSVFILSCNRTKKDLEDVLGGAMRESDSKSTHIISVDLAAA